MNRIAVLLVLYFIGACAAFAQADKPDPQDAAAVEACLKNARANSRPPESCIGIVADPCLDKAEDPTTYGTAKCSEREHLVWDERLNRAYRELMADLEPEKRTELRDMQRSWIAFSDKKCAMHGVLGEGSIVIPITAYCVLVEAGRQALFLEELLGEGDNPEATR
ncbi:MAG: DUF1311 domain-containing protein [Bradyrhizobiaceae bacterium]|nr:DUF1311 domain-containing protein [Bradyrhizobiaceae bacterium]